MKRLYKELAIVLIIFFAAVSFIEWRLSGIKAPIDKILELPGNNPAATILIIGNSHTGALEATTDSSFLKSSVNQSLANLELKDRLKVLEYSLGKGNFKTLILGMDADQIGHTYSSSTYDLQLKKYGFELNDNAVGNRVLAKLNSFRLHLSISDLFTDIVKGSHADTARMNFIPFTNKERNDKEACEKRAEEHSLYMYRKDNNKKNLEILQEIINLCKAKGVSLYLLQTPKPACYSATYNNLNMQAATLQLDSTAKKNNITFLNYFNSPYFTDTDFADYDHLGITGSDKLIAMIKKDLKN